MQFSLWEHWYTALLLSVPVVIGGVLHMVVVTRDMFPALKIPVHRGLFGANKTLRGFIVMPILTIPGALLLAEIARMPSLHLTTPVTQYHWLWLGAALGFSYVLFELPNSFLKRRLGAAPGEVPAKGRHFFVMLDQLDSGIGAAVFYYAFFAAPAATCWLYAISFPFIALVVKRLLYLAKLKKSYV